MNCRNAQLKFSEFLDQGLDPKKARALVAHLKSCPACAKRWERFRFRLEALRDLERIEPSPEFESRLWRRIRQPEPRPVWRVAAEAIALGSLWPKLAGAAAVASVAVGILLVGGVLGPDEGPDEPSAVAGKAYPAGRGSPVATQARPVGTEEWEVPRWARSRPARLESAFPVVDELVDTVGVEPEFVIRRVHYDPSAPPSRAF